MSVCVSVREIKKEDWEIPGKNDKNRDERKLITIFRTAKCVLVHNYYMYVHVHYMIKYICLKGIYQYS